MPKPGYGTAKLFAFGFLFLLGFEAFTSIAQDSTWVWREKGIRSLKFYGLLAYHEGKNEKGIGIPLGIGYQWHHLNGRLRLSSTLQAASFRPLAITDVPDSYYRVTTLGLYTAFDVLRYYSFSLVITAGGGISYSRGFMGNGWNGDTGETIPGGYFNRWYPTAYLAYGIRIAPRKGRYALELFLPPGGHASNTSYLIHALRLGVDYRF